MLCQGGRPSAISNYVVGWELLESSQCSRVSMLGNKELFEHCTEAETHFTFADWAAFAPLRQ